MAKTTTTSTTARKKVRRNVTVGVAHIKATFNNTVITITDTKGETLCWASAGSPVSRAAARARPLPARCRRNRWPKGHEVRHERGRREGEGPRQRSESAITALQAAGLKIKSIEDVTPLPHNGCRPKKRRRVSGARDLGI